LLQQIVSAALERDLPPTVVAQYVGIDPHLDAADAAATRRRRLAELRSQLNRVTSTLGGGG